LQRPINLSGALPYADNFQIFSFAEKYRAGKLSLNFMLSRDNFFASIARRFYEAAHSPE
jgi:hypothetical protein